MAQFALLIVVWDRMALNDLSATYCQLYCAKLFPDYLSYDENRKNTGTRNKYYYNAPNLFMSKIRTNEYTTRRYFYIRIATIWLELLSLLLERFLYRFPLIELHKCVEDKN